MKKEVKEGKVLKVLAPNKLLTRFPILLAQIDDENNSYKLKNEIRQIPYLLHQHNKSLKKFTTVQSSHYNYERKHDCDQRSQNRLL